MKRLFDILLVVVALPLWLPLFGIVALVVLVVEGRPVFFRQERAGKGGKPFRMLKIRTMRNGEGTDEERLTRLGRFLRASSLDELPELLHVLAGTMSLVGPRPLPTRYLPRYSPEQARRHEVRPGNGLGAGARAQPGVVGGQVRVRRVVRGPSVASSRRQDTFHDGASCPLRARHRIQRDGHHDGIHWRRRKWDVKSRGFGADCECERYLVSCRQTRF